MEQYNPNQQYGANQPAQPRLRHAGFGKRLMAYIIDAILIGLVIGILLGALIFGDILTFGLTQIPTTDTSSYSGFLSGEIAILQGFSFVLTLLYFSYFESGAGGGATIGKKILDIKVVNKRNRKVSMGKSLIRNILRAIWSLPCIGFLILLLDVILIATRDQRIGDIAASTYVVEE